MSDQLFRFPPAPGAFSQTTKWRELDYQSPIWQRPGMEGTASSFKLRANAPEGRKRFPINLPVLFCLVFLA